MKNIQDCAILNNGVAVPWLGLGVYKAEDGYEVIQAVQTALHQGYRHIDTAALYNNEIGVGQAIRECGIPREELFITTKVWNSDQGYETTLQAFESSRRKLGLDVIDLYLVHWPVKDKFVETWRALEKLYKEGLVRAIGVSNFQIHHLQEIFKVSDIVPVVNQVECHPLLSQKPLHAFCNANQIQLEAWSPIMRGNLDIPVLNELASKYGKSNAQVVIRWHLQNGVMVIPKSTKSHRIQENANVYDFEISEEDIQRIDTLNQNSRMGADPDNFAF